MKHDDEKRLYEQLRQYVGREDRAKFVWALDFKKLSLPAATAHAGFCDGDGHKVKRRDWCIRAREKFHDMQYGTLPKVATEQEIMETLTREMRSGSGNAAIQAGVKLTELKQKQNRDQKHHDMAGLAKTLLARHGPEKLRVVWECLELPMSELPEGVRQANDAQVMPEVVNGE